MEIGQGFVAPELTFRPKTLGQTSLAANGQQTPQPLTMPAIIMTFTGNYYYG